MDGLQHHRRALGGLPIESSILEVVPDFREGGQDDAAGVECHLDCLAADLLLIDHGSSAVDLHQGREVVGELAPVGKEGIDVGRVDGVLKGVFCFEGFFRGDVDEVFWNFCRRCCGIFL